MQEVKAKGKCSVSVRREGLQSGVNEGSTPMEQGCNVPFCVMYRCTFLSGCPEGRSLLG